MTSRIRLWLVCSTVGAVLLTACGGGNDDDKPGAVAYRTVACAPGQTLPQGVSLECGTLTVPESRSASATASASARTIELAVLRLSRKDRVSTLPLLWLEGGPGGAASDSIGLWAESSALAVRDVILFDQRGTGLSSPALSCPELFRVQSEHFTRPQAVSVELEAARGAVDVCVRRATEAGIDLRAYNSIETALDTRDLRRALKIERWHVMGGSYGTRAALAVMRYANEGVASFVLDSVSPPDDSASARVAAANAEQALERLFASCAADAQCSASHGDLRQRFLQMEARFNASPWTLNIDSGQATQPTPYTMRGGDFAFLIFRLMYDPEALPTLPGLIAALAAGRTSEAESAVRAFLAGFSPSASGGFQLTYLAVECNDLRRLSTAADDEFERNPGRWPISVLIAAGPYCDRLPGSGNPVDYNQPVASSTPTLLLAGEFDPVTLPESTRQAGATLSRATGVLIQGAGHVPGLNTVCGKEVVDAFLASPESPALPACARPLVP
jgi:pimeloyl-ACP methyl ester carboxylesterase